MKPRLNTILTFILAGTAGGALAQELAQGQGLKLYGSVTGGIITSSTSSQNAWKAKEYRDLGSGVLAGFDVKGRTRDYYFDAFGENIGRDDMRVDVKGGKYGVLRYQVFDDRLTHNWTFGAKTPYNGAGGNTLTAALPNLNSATWNTFDFRKKRENFGGNFEFWNNSPWFLRVDANEVRERGTQLIAGVNGTTPGHGFTDKPFPVDYTTNNYSLETGYASKLGQLTLSLQHSHFKNTNEQLLWTNGLMGPAFLDTTYLPPSNQYNKIGLNGVLKQLPYNSTLSGRFTHSQTTDSFGVATTALNPTFAGTSINPGSGTLMATNPSVPNFSGKVIHETASASLHSNWSKDLDSRIYWNWFKKDNRSTQVVFNTAATAGLSCSTTVNGNCPTETLDYKKNNLGAEFGYRVNPQNRVIAGFDYVDLDRNRVDFDNTKDKTTRIEWRNTSLDWLGARVKYQHLERRSHFLEGAAGANGGDPLFLNRFIARFDASNVDQDLVKAGVDIQPAELWDIGLEAIYKQNKFKDTVLGRTKDDRQQYYGSVAYGDPRKFRVMTFADVELVKYDSVHRNISQLTAAGTVVATDIYNPLTPAECSGTTCNYNWNATNRDRSWAVGIGADWLPREYLKINASAIYQNTHGSADFSVQPTPAAINPAAVPISNFDNTRRVSLNLKGTYSVTKQFDLTAGFAHEIYRFSDIALDGYRYTINGGTTGGCTVAACASYLSGAYANPNYTLNAFYILGTYKF